MSNFKLNAGLPIKNNGATVVGGGNVNLSGPVSKNLSLRNLGVEGNLGHTVKELSPINDSGSQPYGVTSANNGVGYVFAYEPAKYGDRSVIAKGVGSKINRVNSTVMSSTASEYNGLPRNKSNVVNGATIVDGDHWLMPPPPSGGGKIHPGFEPNPLRGSGYNFTNGKGGVAADKNTTSSRSVPGEITFRTGSPIPVTQNLKPRDESEGVGP